MMAVYRRPEAVDGRGTGALSLVSIVGYPLVLPDSRPGSDYFIFFGRVYRIEVSVVYRRPEAVDGRGRRLGCVVYIDSNRRFCGIGWACRIICFGF